MCRGGVVSADRLANNYGLRAVAGEICHAAHRSAWGCPTGGVGLLTHPAVCQLPTPSLGISIVCTGSEGPAWVSTGSCRYRVISPHMHSTSEMSQHMYCRNACPPCRVTARSSFPKLCRLHPQRRPSGSPLGCTSSVSSSPMRLLSGSWCGFQVGGEAAWLGSVWPVLRVSLRANSVVP